MHMEQNRCRFIAKKDREPMQAAPAGQQELTQQGQKRPRQQDDLRRVQSAPLDGMGDMRGQASTTEDVLASHQHCLDQQSKFQPSTRMLSLQRDITGEMRSMLVDWLGEVRDEFRLSSETLFLAVRYLDRYLCKAQVSRSSFQLLGITCLWIAAKYEETSVPTAAVMAAMTAGQCSVKDLKTMEKDVLTCLGFELVSPTALRFLHHFLLLLPSLPPAGPGIPPSTTAVSMRRLSEALLEMTLYDAALLDTLPSVQGVVDASGAEPAHLRDVICKLMKLLVTLKGGPSLALMRRYEAWTRTYGELYRSNAPASVMAVIAVHEEFAAAANSSLSASPAQPPLPLACMPFAQASARDQAMGVNAASARATIHLLAADSIADTSAADAGPDKSGMNGDRSVSAYLASVGMEDRCSSLSPSADPLTDSGLFGDTAVLVGASAILAGSASDSREWSFTALSSGDCLTMSHTSSSLVSSLADMSLPVSMRGSANGVASLLASCDASPQAADFGPNNDPAPSIPTALLAAASPYANSNAVAGPPYGALRTQHHARSESGREASRLGLGRAAIRSIASNPMVAAGVDQTWKQNLGSMAASSAQPCSMAVEEEMLPICRILPSQGISKALSAMPCAVMDVEQDANDCMQEDQENQLFSYEQLTPLEKGAQRMLLS